MSPHDPLLSWFRQRGWKPFPFQQECWTGFLEGRDGLCYAPTGMGKTLAAIGGPILAALEEDPARSQLRVLWITPLRALAHDTTESLREVVQHVGLPWRVEARTGDTPQSLKAAQRKRLPEVLVTTPESASLLLSYPECRTLFGGVQAIIADEWHELLSTKRGTQSELVFAGVEQYSGRVPRWGLSATLENLEHAAEALAPPRRWESPNSPSPLLINAAEQKQFSLRIVLPKQREFFPLVGNFGGHLLQEVIALIDQRESTLLFTNTRNQAERWFREILLARPEWKEKIGLHHGSLDRDERVRIEEALREGSVKGVVCTSSLDLGVDFSPVEQVIQIGSPKGIARILQRAGRSGHSPGKPSILYGVPTHALELVEFLAVRSAIQAGKIEPRKAREKPLDLLVQHLVTRILGGREDEEKLLREVQETYAFRNLTPEEWSWAIQFIISGGAALKAYPEYQKVERDEEERLTVPDRRTAQHHRMSIGTITADGLVSIRFVKGGTLGSVEESFIAQLSPGDTFYFAGRSLELIQFRDMKAYVKRSQRKKAVVPRWMGGRMPLSSHLGREVHRTMRQCHDGEFSHASPQELHSVADLLALQERWSYLPDEHTILIEEVKTRDGYHTTCFPFEGRLVHEGLGVLFAYRLSQQEPRTIAVSANDYGLNLITPEPLALTESQWRDILAPAQIENDLFTALNESEMARRKFREIARVAGLIFQGFPGSRKTARQMQVSSGLLFDVLSKYDSENALVHQAHEEVLQEQLELPRLTAALERIEKMNLLLSSPARLTPLSFPLWAENIQSRLSSESAGDRIERMLQQLTKDVTRQGGVK
ncbi:ligase-associated DNA damage response DEXH box helicase [bacterium]|nr:ligase-associated DNA damage response DEXH box helicase [bacterium]